MEPLNHLYGKIFKQIFDSSIADNWKTRVVFQDLIILADSGGLVDMTPESIAARTRYPLEMVLEAIAELLAPDPRSRTPDKEGRRLELVSTTRTWGYRIVNYQSYRAIKAEFDRRTYQRRYMRKARNRNKIEGSETNSLTDVNNEFTSPSSSPSLSSSKDQVQTPKTPPRPSLAEVKLYCAKAGISDPDAEWFFYKCEGNGWLNSGKPIKRWGSTLMSWKSAGYLPSQKPQPSVRYQSPVKEDVRRGFNARMTRMEKDLDRLGPE